MSSGALKELRGRIRSVISIQQTTRAMRMISAVKLRRAQDRLMRLRPYREAAQTFLHTLFSLVEEPTIYQQPAAAEKSLYVVLSSSRGLCGAFNSSLIRWLGPQLPPPPSAELFILGKKAYELLKKSSYAIEFEDLFGQKEIAPQTLKALATRLLEAFLGGRYRAIYLVYNKFGGIGRASPIVEPLLPLALDSPRSGDYLSEPAPEKLVAAYVPVYVEAVLRSAIQESLTAEHAARMVAMQVASDNAEELLRELRLAYNKARQAAITKELLEIVGGAEALKG